MSSRKVAPTTRTGTPSSLLPSPPGSPGHGFGTADRPLRRPPLRRSPAGPTRSLLTPTPTATTMRTAP